MSLFRKKKEDNKELPSLPSLPKLPELPSLEDKEIADPQIPKLPSYPSSSIGTKLSHDTIKDAVSDEENNSYEDLSDEGNMEIREGFYKPKKSIEEEGMSRYNEKDINNPVFIRIDKFEDAMRIFDESKKKISEIERVLEEIKKVKEKESRELESWESEIKSMKEQISKVDKDIFSKV